MSLFGFANALGWLAFLSIIPLIILYLIRPRPKDLDIPSLMFFIKARSAAEKRSFFRTFIRDWLFWLQLLCLLLLSLAVVDPFVMVKKDVISDNVVLVIDASASSQIIDNGKSRFEQSISEAKKLLGSKNSVVLVKGNSAIGVRDRNRRETIDYLDSLQPTDTRSKVGDAILLAGDIIDGKGRVIVFSDFINTEGTHPEIAKAILTSKGMTVDFINTIKEKKKNVGIVDIKADDEATSVFIKNFGESGETIILTARDFTKTLFVNSGKIETVSFGTSPGITKVEIITHDDFPVDDVAYVSAPDEEIVKILLITNKESLYTKAALQSLKNVQVEVAEPPVIPKADFDVYIVDNINPTKILPGTFAELKRKAESGASVVIIAQDITRGIDYENILPVSFMGVGGAGTILADQASRITKDVEFGGVDSYFETNLDEGAISLAKVSNSSVIALEEAGNGKIIYYGIIEGKSDFKLSPSYPIFWSNMLKFLTNQNDITSLNMKTGTALVFDKPEKVSTPKGDVTKQTVILDKIGIYATENKKIAANLLSDAESNINEQKQKLGQGLDKFVFAPVKENVQLDFGKWLIILAIFLMFLEVICIKFRGEV